MDSRIPVKFLIVSDTHGQDFFSDDDGQRDPYWPQETIPAADVILHCGDLTNNGSLPDHMNALDMVSKFNAELKLVIAGNHDRSLDVKLMENASIQEQQTSRKVLKRWTGDKARQHGIHYLTEGLHSFTLSSGASFTIFASPYTPEFNNWAFGYPHSVDRFQNLRSSHPDIVMTHGPPFGYLDSANGKHFGCPHLLSAVIESKPQIHCFGHIHDSSGAQSLDWKPHSKASQVIKHGSDWISKVSTDNETLLVNAAMVDERNNANLPSPWKVELLLPTQSPDILAEGASV